MFTNKVRKVHPLLGSPAFLGSDGHGFTCCCFWAGYLCSRSQRRVQQLSASGYCARWEMGPLCLRGCPACCRMFGSILGLYLLNAHSPSPTALKLGQQKCLQTLPNVIQGTSSSVTETTTVLSKSWFNTILSLLRMVSTIGRQVNPCQMSNSPNLPRLLNS